MITEFYYGYIAGVKNKNKNKIICCLIVIYKQ